MTVSGIEWAHAEVSCTIDEIPFTLAVYIADQGESTYLVAGGTLSELFPARRALLAAIVESVRFLDQESGPTAVPPTFTALPTSTPSPTLIPPPTSTLAPAPTRTPTQSPTPRPTATPTVAPTSTPTSTPLPLPDAVVRVVGLNVRRGPGTEYPIISSVNTDDKLVVLGTNDAACSWLKVITPKFVTGWVSGAPRYVTRNLDCGAIDQADYPQVPPYTGTFVVKGLRDGWGQLRVDNEGTLDAVVVLATLREKPVVAFYVRSHESFTVTDISHGKYLLFYALGSDWDQNEARFTDALYFRSDTNYAFSVVELPDRIIYSVWTVTLSAEDGDTRAISLDADEFPQLK